MLAEAECVTKNRIIHHLEFHPSIIPLRHVLKTLREGLIEERTIYI